MRDAHGEEDGNQPVWTYNNDGMLIIPPLMPLQSIPRLIDHMVMPSIPPTPSIAIT
jgi:hypothetical protein